MKTRLVAAVGVTGMVLAGCGGKAEFTPLALANGGAMAGAPTGGAQAWNGGGSGIPAFGGAGSAPSPAQGGQSMPIGTGGALGVAGGVGGRASASGGRATGGTLAVGGGAGSGGSRATGGTLAVAGSGGSRATGGTLAVAGRAGSGGSRATGGTPAVGGTGAVGGLVAGDGGASVAVGGSTGIIGPPRVPAGCELMGDPASDGSFCAVNLVCDNDYVNTFCSVDYQGGWYCECLSNNRYLTYVVKGAESAEACAAVSELCSSADPLEIMGPETCVADGPTPQGSYCGLQCERTAELRGGVSATLTTSMYASCSYQNGRQRCQCSNGMSSRTFDISDADGASSCKVALDLCGSDAPIVFDGPTRCEAGYEYSYVGYCESQQDCWQSVAVREDVTALQYDSRYSSCHDDHPGGTYCSCYGNQWSLAFQLPERAADSGACADAQAVCARPEDVVLSGGLECERSYQSAGPDYCDAQITCAEPATWGDLDLILNPGIGLNCQPKSSGAWICMCYSGTQTVGFELEAAQGWDVCTAAAERCPDLVDVTRLDSSVGWVGPL
jgi:hypothetical protein